MRKLKTFIGLCVILLIIPIVIGANENGKIISGGKLLITDADVKVDGSTHKVTYELEIEKEKNEVRFTRNTITSL